MNLPEKMRLEKLWSLDFSSSSSFLFKKFVAPPRGVGTGSTTQVLPEYKRDQEQRTAGEPVGRTPRRAVAAERAGGGERAAARDG